MKKTEQQVQSHPEMELKKKGSVKHNIIEKFTALIKQQGIKIHNAVLLGRWLHLDINKADEMHVRQHLSAMKPEYIKTMQPGKDGKHLDGSRHYRIIAKF